MVITPPPPSSGDQPAGIGTSIELFTGGGGLALAMHDAGFRHLLAVELDKRACATLRANKATDFIPDAEDPRRLDDRWPLVEGDVGQVDFTRWEGKVDVVAGGVPCQPWSLGGVGKGYDDPRNLWPELFRCVRETRPKAIIAENVKGLLRPSFKPYYDYILRELGAPFEQRVDGEDWRDHDKRLTKTLASGKYDLTERYEVKHLCLNAADYGVPQIRHRVFVVAFRKDLAIDWDFPDATHSAEALAHAQADGSYWAEHHLQPPAVATLPSMKIPENTQRWRTLRDAVTTLPEPLGDKVEHPDWLHHYGWPGAREYTGHTANVLDRPAKTVKAGVHGVPGGETVMRDDAGRIRYMTVREVARVMTFPDSWRLDGPRGEQMRQLGNAVPVELATVIAKSVVESLLKSR
ncbi:DNA cytosine methyltransferase [Micromonospora sp. NPDC023888]|uniref:DNA cytosine methyltransferase n=1 Tax=Micromonospora sp. NPDC023888 TaxID=3155607 RepID=UPI0033C1A702